jgi:hypothetical protein
MMGNKVINAQGDSQLNQVTDSQVEVQVIEVEEV